MTTWDEETTFKFLEVYQTESVIWDPKDKYHKDKSKVNDAWFRISSKIEIAVAELKNKKESLMACFRSHLKKKKASIKSGAGEKEIYKPIWPFYNVMEVFHTEIYECAPTICTGINIEGEGSRSDEPSISIRSTPSTSRTCFAFNKDGQRKRRREANPELQEAETRISDVLTTLNDVLYKRQNETVESKDDEFDLYGKLLAKKLRKIPEDLSERAMNEIDNVMKVTMEYNRNRNNLWNAGLPMNQTFPSYLAPPSMQGPTGLINNQSTSSHLYKQF